MIYLATRCLPSRPNFLVHATIPEIELMESQHDTQLGVCDTRAEASSTSDSRYTAGGRAITVYS